MRSGHLFRFFNGVFFVHFDSRLNLLFLVAVSNLTTSVSSTSGSCSLALLSFSFSGTSGNRYRFPPFTADYSNHFSPRDIESKTLERIFFRFSTSFVTAFQSMKIDLSAKCLVILLSSLQLFDEIREC